MISKKEIIEAINDLPEDEFSDVDAVIEEIILLDKIKRGINAVKNGDVISEEDVDKIIEKW